jgi:hypothetical protein
MTHARRSTRLTSACGFLVVAIAIAACDNKPKSLTAPDGASPSIASAGGAPSRSMSSVCAGYEKEREDARLASVQNPRDQALKDAVTTYDTLIGDACQ